MVDSTQTSLFIEFPSPGAMVQIEVCCVPLANSEEGKLAYFFTERAVLKKKLKDGRWIAEIAMGMGNWWSKGQSRWYKDGTEVILSDREFRELE